MDDLSTAPILPGETLAGKYKIERVLGRGGMGIVVAARHLDLDEHVAIKFLVGEAPAGALERFQREARAAAKVKSEHVCRVLDVGKVDTGEPYIVMEHLEGEDLAERLEREGPQPYATVVGWIIEACDALAEAHALGIVHRDLKPPNLYLAKRPDGSTCTKVLDFGISKIPSSQAMTSTQVMMGSPAYMSPEQIESSRDVDARSDIWSLGATMYELLTNAQPFEGETMMQLAVQIREKPHVPLRERNPEVPEALADVIDKCLGKLPSARYSSVVALAAALVPFAPHEVASIANRLARRATPRSHAALAHAATMPDGARHGSSPDLASEVVSARSAATDVAGPSTREANATFNPVQSAATGEERRRSLKVVALGSVALLAGVAAFLGLRAKGTPEAITPSSSVTSQVSPPPPAISQVATADASTSSSTDVPATAAPAFSAAASSPAVVAPAVSISSSAKRRAPRVEAAEKPGGTPATTPSTATSSLPVPAASATTPPASTGRRRPELDRNDPF